MDSPTILAFFSADVRGCQPPHPRTTLLKRGWGNSFYIDAIDQPVRGGAIAISSPKVATKTG
jgi:hypothetical protein